MPVFSRLRQTSGVPSEFRFINFLHSPQAPQHPTKDSSENEEEHQARAAATHLGKDTTLLSLVELGS